MDDHLDSIDNNFDESPSDDQLDHVDPDHEYLDIENEDIDDIDELSYSTIAEQAGRLAAQVFDDQDDQTPIKVVINVSNMSGGEIVGTKRVVTLDTFRWYDAHEIIEKIQNVLVPGKATKIPEDLERFRIISINGDRYSGRYSLALHLAIRLHKLSGCDIYSLGCVVDSSLFNFLLDTESPENGIFILRNAFDSPGILKKDLLEAASDLTHLLEERNSYIIITDDKTIDLPSEIAQVQAEKLTLSERKELITNYVSKSIYKIQNEFENALQSEKLINALAKVLLIPADIDTFIATLSSEKVPPEDIDKFLLEKANDIAKTEIRLDEWFGTLNDLEKYFAFAVALFPDLKVDDLIKRFKDDNAILQQQKSNLGLPLDLSLKQYLKNTNCRVSEWGTIEFEDSQITEFILGQLHGDYFFHLWELADAYSEMVRSHPEKADLQVRLNYSRALGELGKIDFNRLSSILRNWCESEHYSVRAATGYALKQVCTSRSLVASVENLIRSWMHDSSKEIRWSSIAAGERLYSNIPETVFSAIHQLSKDWHIHRAIVNALNNISKNDLSSISNLLLDWLSNPEETHPIRRKIALDASYKILQKLNPTNSSRRRKLLPIAQALLLINEKTCKITMSIFKSWLNRNPSEDCVNDIGDLIADSLASENLNKDYLTHILERDWLIEKDEEMHDLAKNLLQYIETISEPLPRETGVIIVDISEQDSDWQRKIEVFCRDTRNRLDKYFKTSIICLGVHSSYHENVVDQMASKGVSLNFHGLKPARVIGPILERLELQEIKFVLVVTSENIIDLDDWVNSEWAKKIIINDYKNELDRIIGFFYISSRSPEQVEGIITTI